MIVSVNVLLLCIWNDYVCVCVCVYIYIYIYVYLLYHSLQALTYECLEFWRIPAETYIDL